MMLDFNIVNASAIAVLIVIFIRYILPYLKKTKSSYYEEIKLGLMLFGYAFRDEKVREIANTVLVIVREIESLHLAPDEKHSIAVEQTFKVLVEEFNMELEPDAMDLIIRLAVSMLPKTNQ